MKTRFGSNYHFAGVGKMIAGGKLAVPKMALIEKHAGRLIIEKKNNAE